MPGTPGGTWQADPPAADHGSWTADPPAADHGPWAADAPAAGSDPWTAGAAAADAIPSLGRPYLSEGSYDDGLGDMATPQTRRLHPGRAGADNTGYASASTAGLDEAAPSYATPPGIAEPGNWPPTFTTAPGGPQDAIPSYATPPGTAEPGNWPPSFDAAPSNLDAIPPYASPPGTADHDGWNPAAAAPPADGYDSPAGTHPGSADGPYGGTWTAGSPYGGPAAPHGDGEPPDSRSTNRWAIASLVAGLLGGGAVILGAVFGSIALGKIRLTGQRGTVLAISGIALSGFWALVVIVVIAVFAVTSSSPGNQATRAPNGQISKSGSLSVFSLSVGDCFDNPASQQDISSVTAVPCTAPHDAQVFAKFGLSGSNSIYPTNLTQMASNGCNAQENHLNESLVTDSMAIRFIYPVLHAWEIGQRTVTCLIVTPANVSTSLVNS
jgi:hypothetical protein